MVSFSTTKTLMVIEVFISFGKLWSSMPRPKKKGPKAIKRSVSIDPEIYDWVNKKIKKKRFSTLSHAINEALLHFKEDMED